MLSPVLIAPPSETPVSLEEAKLHCRVDSDDEDTLVAALISAATGHLDGVSGTLGRCIMAQTWSQEYEIASGDLVLPLGPVSSVVSVTSEAGAFEDYQQLKDGRGPFLRLNSGAAWPSGSVTVEFVAGEDEAPAAIKAAILLHVGTLYLNRESVVVGTNASALPMAYHSLLAPYRVWRG
jgi:uncharacterized phiE125 gp8 family phage protein